MNRAAVENRTDSRISYSQPVNYTTISSYLHLSDEIFLQGTILNISGSGMRIRTDVRPDFQEMVIRAWIPLPQPSVAVPVIAIMKWVKEENDRIYDIGFEFML